MAKTSNTPTPADNLQEVPTAAEYKAAFLAARSALRSSVGSSVPLKLLQANYDAPDHAATAGELAEAIGLDTFNQASLAYGKFAKAIAEKLDKKPKFNLSVLVTFSEIDGDDGFVRWTMIPNVITALEELGWVGGPRSQRG